MKTAAARNFCACASIARSSPDMHAQALDFARRVLAAPTPVTGHRGEVGGRNVNGSVRSLVVETASYTGVDLMPGPDVDVVADGAAFVPAGEERKPELVVCMETLEHTPAGKNIIANAAKILAHDG